MFNVYLTARRGALLGASGDQTTRLSFFLWNPSCRAKRWQSFLKLFLSLLMVFFSSIFYLLLSISFFISFRSLLGSILSSQTDPPTFKNDGFMRAAARFLKNQHFRSKDGFESVLGLSRPPFGSSWGSPGGLLGAPSGLWIDQRGPPDSSWNSLGPRLLASCCRKWPWEGSGAVFGSFLVLPRAFWGVFWPPSNRFRPSKLPFRASIP